MISIHLSLVAIYKEANGQVGTLVRVLNIVTRENSVNPNVTVMPWDESGIVYDLNSLQRLGLVNNPMGGYSLTTQGKSLVENGGLLAEWERFEDALKK